MVDDIVLNKSDIIKKCVQRVFEEYADNPNNLDNITKQDSIILNIQRACEVAIDLGMHVIAEKGLEIPQWSRDAFDILSDQGIIDNAISERLKAMVGFRDIAIHNYQKLSIKIIQSIIEKHLKDFVDFTEIIQNL
jgi:uncharacterized protein YutE (UPF0331/DUF86 family)